MNMFKNNGGFTLVELIVVIAILAILAGVAVPVYSGYITKAQNVQTQIDEAAQERAFEAACAFLNENPDNYEWEFNGTFSVTGGEKAAAIAAQANEFMGVTAGTGSGN